MLLFWLLKEIVVKKKNPFESLSSSLRNTVQVVAFEPNSEINRIYLPGAVTSKSATTRMLLSLVQMKASESTPPDVEKSLMVWCTVEVTVAADASVLILLDYKWMGPIHRELDMDMYTGTHNSRHTRFRGTWSKLNVPLRRRDLQMSRFWGCPGSVAELVKDSWETAWWATSWPHKVALRIHRCILRG